ncbi:MAG: protein kinase [Planctomycetia bacterium]|nr:protein kinase [Planctomycetia bacterium]
MSAFEKNFRETIDFGTDSGGSGAEQKRHPLSPGDILSEDYVLRVRLGRGGMGEIWKADELSNGKFLRHVVIKVVAPDIQNAEQELRRVEEMFYRIHGLQHQHICPMYAMKEDPVYGAFIVMKYIEGETLQDYYEEYVREHGTFPLTELTRLLAPIADALDYSHTKKVMHRDVKPQNIMVSRDEGDGVQLIDFGLVADLQTSMVLSTVTQINTTSGTLPYMSPEQWSGEYQDAQTDQFSLAVVAYELLAGHLPFVANDIQVLGFQILNKTPQKIESLPEYVNQALQKALAKNRKERFHTCAEFIRALENPDWMKQQDNKKRKRPVISVVMVSFVVLSILLMLFVGEKFLREKDLPESKKIVEYEETQKPEVIPESETVIKNSEKQVPGASGVSPSEMNPEERESAGNDVVSDKEIQNKEDLEKTGGTAEAHFTDADSDKQKLSGQESSSFQETVEVPSVEEPDALSEDVSEVIKTEETKKESQKTETEHVKTEEHQKTETERVKTEKEEPEDVTTQIVPSAEELLASAHQAVKEKKWEEADSRFTAYLKQNPSAVDVYRQRAEVCREMKLYARAYGDYQYFLGHSKNEEELLDVGYACAQMCAQIRFYSQALSEYIRLEQKMAGTQDSRLSEIKWERVLIQVNVACEENTQEKYNFAYEGLQELLKEDPQNSILLAEQARLFFVTKREEHACDKAREQLNLIIQKAPECVQAYLYRGMMRRDIYTQAREAEKDISTALGMIKGNSARENELRMACYYQLAVTAIFGGDVQEGIKNFTLALDIFPDHPVILTERGILYLEQNMLEKAFHDFTKVQKMLPDHIKSLAGLGEYYLKKAETEVLEKARKKDYSCAGEIFTRLLQKDKSVKNQVEYHENLVKVYKAYGNKSLMEKHRKAIHALQNAL